MRILMVTAGSHGDIHPFLGIGRALAARGHDAVLMTNPYFEQDAQAAGLPFRPHGEHIDLPAFIREHALMHPIRGPMQVFRWLFELTPTLLEELDRAILDLKPDVVFHHAICFGTGWVCAKHAIPTAVAALQPAVWWNADDPAPVLQREAGDARKRRARTVGRVIAPIARPLASWKLNRLRLRCGYPKTPDAMLREFRGGDLPLGLWSPAIRPPLAGDPPGARITGFPFYDAGLLHPTPPDVERFLDDSVRAGDAPIVFALGTTAIHVAGEFYRHAAEACRRLGIRGLLLTGRSDNIPARLPPGVIAARYAPFSAVLPRGRASVIHGGVGSMAQALAAGRPTLVAPFSHDQFNNGVRVEDLGVGLSLGTRPLTLERLEHALRRVLTDHAMHRRADALGVTLRAEDGCDNAAQAIENLSRPDIRTAPAGTHSMHAGTIGVS